MQNFPPARLLLCTLLAAASLPAQTHRVDAPQKVTRAVAVYEWTGDLAKPTAARLVPVTVFIEGAFQDGGSYYARPIPLALLNGNIYSLEKSGVPQGNVTLDYARHLQTAVSNGDTADLGWYGFGSFSALPAPRKTAALHASASPPEIISSNDPDRPTFVRRNTGTAARPASSDDKTTTTAGPSAPDDPDRPHFGKAPTASTPPPDPSDPEPTSTTPTSTPASTTTRTHDDSADPTNDPDRPTLRRRDPKQAAADRKARDRSGATGVGDLNNDPDRPTIKRGATKVASSAVPQLGGMPTGLHQIVAVSDPATREPHPFAREWATPIERADTLAKLEIVAQQQLADYNRTNAVAPAPPPPPAKPRPKAATRARRTPPPPPAPAAAPLTDENITSYTLSYGGLPTFVFTATSKPTPISPDRYVTLVAQQLPSGELQVALSSVTDAAHLDRTPWFRLVDAVDPDAEHRASLLFELRGQNSRQFALYRILSAKAEQLFATNPTM